MGELLLLAHVVLFVAGWFSFLYWKRQLNDCVRSASTKMDLEGLERAISRLLSKLAFESERLKREIDTRLRQCTAAPSTRGSEPPECAVVGELLDNGLDPVEVARRTERSIAEIELISIRRRKTSAPAILESQQAIREET